MQERRRPKAFRKSLKKYDEALVTPKSEPSQQEPEVQPTTFPSNCKANSGTEGSLSDSMVSRLPEADAVNGREEMGSRLLQNFLTFNALTKLREQAMVSALNPPFRPMLAEQMIASQCAQQLMRHEVTNSPLHPAMFGAPIFASPYSLGSSLAQGMMMQQLLQDRQL
mmetsp:Transcript_26724/g.70180  ORF Transcript_26724/g.70180 Transcript_26724/m.70180 type:complete len:167 (+) Transcript_26724:539-1039(+)|eukprot:CAMPEP_0113721802 /NCGR_PEP_ID=MMETSP0038_2-20120614/37355_1 /TAXON_ID=2898 /ORGANISM="Cryptomonas paramecium" /LENGTH=166 /DNA_ID=CAMNT_0000650891 /DNA_START=374 /DNA_END=874 /DNA_ORIENTATION=- /assembly_acc=CAM_ASM_000170